MFPFRATALVFATLLVWPRPSAQALTEFQTLSAGFGNAATVAGVQVGNPDANNWTAASEGAPAKATALSNPHIAAADALGNIYVADKGSHAVLKISPDGTIRTFAGTHLAGFNGDGPAAATQLQIFSPNGLYVLPNGVVYLLDPGNKRIRRVGLDGIMTTVVTDPEPDWHASGRALWVRPDEQLLYYTNEFNTPLPGNAVPGAVVKRWTPSGGIELVCNRAVGFVNPGNLDVNPADGKLYVCDRAEDDATNLATGLWRIDGVNQRTRMTGNSTQADPADNRPALTSYLREVRGIAFLRNGGYFVCGHKDGSIWYVDTAGLLHLYLQGSGKKDGYTPPDGLHPPLTGTNYFAQPRGLTIAPNGNLIATTNDSGYVLIVKNVVPPSMPANLRSTHIITQGFRLDWTPPAAGQAYVIERALNLQPPVWQVIGASGGGTFTDPGATDYSRAFYRLSAPR